MGYFYIHYYYILTYRLIYCRNQLVGANVVKMEKIVSNEVKMGKWGEEWVNMGEMEWIFGARLSKSRHWSVTIVIVIYDIRSFGSYTRLLLLLLLRVVNGGACSLTSATPWLTLANSQQGRRVRRVYWQSRVRASIQACVQANVQRRRVVRGARGYVILAMRRACVFVCV